MAWSAFQWTFGWAFLGSIAIISLAREESKYEHKVKGGGWSHLNWQRSAETVWRRNA